MKTAQRVCVTYVLHIYIPFKGDWCARFTSDYCMIYVIFINWIIHLSIKYSIVLEVFHVCWMEKKRSKNEFWINIYKDWSDHNFGKKVRIIWGVIGWTLRIECPKLRSYNVTSIKDVNQHKQRQIETKKQQRNSIYIYI